MFNNLKIIPHLKLLRASHWTKNIFVFAPPFFDGQIMNPSLFFMTFFAALSFSLVSSSIYILNDWIDRESDSLHPLKKFRPFASGAVSPKSGAFLGALTTGIALILSLNLLVNSVLIVIGIYFVLNVAYSLKLKHYALIDVFCIAVGFVLRLFAGSTATGITLSSWIVTLTFLLAMFLGLAKRRDDVLLQEIGGNRLRNSVNRYNCKFLEHSMTVMAAIVIVSYLMYCHAVSPSLSIPSGYLFLTTGFVVLGILRYLQIALVEDNTGSPTKILMSDRFIQVNLLLWAGTFTWILY